MIDQTCRICSGTLKTQRITHVQPHDGHFVVIENLPALVCEQCGEIYLTPDAHDQIVQVLQRKTAPTRLETIEVYDLSA